MFSADPAVPGAVPAPLAPELSLSGRLLAVRRRRLALRLRGWLGVAAIAAFSLTLVAVTLFSLLGR